MTRTIYTRHGREVLLDDDDYAKFHHLKWSVTDRGYVGRKEGSKYYLLHRLITHAPADMVVDHINGNKLDNRRCNLRICTHQQNLFNQGSKPNTSSRFKGVYWHKVALKWQARIRINGRIPSLGMYDNETDAARAFDAAARIHHGEFARLNFADEVQA